MEAETFVPAIAIIFIFGAPIAAFIVTRVLAHQERMEMLRRGIAPPPNPREMRRAMKYGWTPNATPAGMPAHEPYPADYHPQYQLRRGMQVAFVGLALLIGLGFIGYRGDGTYVYGPWLLGGLIPLFVGIAQIIGAVLAGASFGPPVAQQQHFGPPPSAPSSPGPAREAGSTMPGPTYGGWRPGTTPEIEKPASPPDYRG